MHGYISKSTKRHGLVTAIKRILSEISIEAAPIVVDAQARGEHLEHYWSFGVGAGRVNEGFRAAWHEHLVRANTVCTARPSRFVLRSDHPTNTNYK